MKWLITGGCGFIGTSLIRYLLSTSNDSIRVIDNLTVGTREDLATVCQFTEVSADHLSHEISNGVELIQGDIRDEELALKVGQGIDVIVHLAANSGVIPSIENPHLDCVTNVIGTLNYLEAARHNQIKRFIFASSGGTVIGNCTPPIHEEMTPHPVAPYGASKSAGEGYCSAYYRTFGVETVVLRFGNVYGVGSNHKNSVVAKFIRRAMEGEILEIYGDGTQTRDFIYIGDLIEAILKAATVENIGGEVFQIATNAETTINELAETLIPILEAANLKTELHYTSPLSGEVKRNFADTSKARKMIGWQAKTDLKTGLRQTVEWFIKTTHYS